jgi:hypothetical protein
MLFFDSNPDSREDNTLQHSMDAVERRCSYSQRDNTQWYAVDVLLETGSHEVRGSIPLGSTTLPNLTLSL